MEAEGRLWLGKGLTWAGQHHAAREALEAALAVARERGLRRVMTESLRYLAIVASNISEFARAKELLAEAIAVNREDNDDEGESTAVIQLATVLYNEGHFAEAREILERALPIVVASGFRYREAVVVSNLAAIVVQQGELGHGRRLITRGLQLCTDLDDLEGIATAYNIRGEIERRVGDLDGCRAVVAAPLWTRRCTTASTW